MKIWKQKSRKIYFSDKSSSIAYYRNSTWRQTKYPRIFFFCIYCVRLYINKFRKLHSAYSTFRAITPQVRLQVDVAFATVWRTTKWRSVTGWNAMDSKLLPLHYSVVVRMLCGNRTDSAIRIVVLEGAMHCVIVPGFIMIKCTALAIADRDLHKYTARLIRMWDVSPLSFETWALQVLK